MDYYIPAETLHSHHQHLSDREVDTANLGLPILKQTCFLVGEGSLLIECTKLLLEKGFEIRGILSQDKQIQDFALKSQLPLLSPTTDFVPILAHTPFDYLFSITNKRILPSAVLKLPQKLAINYHDSLLPSYAGFYATCWAILNQEKEHGITWHLMDEGIDTGHIVKQRLISLAEEETSISLNLKCYEAAIGSFEQLVGELVSGQVQTMTQPLGSRSYYPGNKRLRQGGIVSWRQSAAEISALFRALDFGRYFNPIGLPKIWVGNACFILSKLSVIPTASVAPPGTIVAVGPDEIQVATATQHVGIREIQTLDGEVASLADAIEKFNLVAGYRLEEIPSTQAAHLEKVDKQSAKYQDYWTEKLLNFQPLPIPFSQLRQAAVVPDEMEEITFSVNKLNDGFLTEGMPDDRASDWIITAFLVYLFRISGNTTIGVGFQSTEAAWKQTEIPPLFAETLPFQVALSAEMAFSSAHETCLTELKKIAASQTYTRDLSLRHPALRANAAGFLQNAYPVIIQKTRRLTEATTGCTNALNLVASDESACKLVYHPKVWKKQDIEAIAHQFKTLLQDIAGHAHQPIKTLSLLTERERHQLLFEWNQTGAPYPREKVIHQLFEEQVARNPQAIALVSGSSTVTYEELNRQANQVARYLQKLGVGPEVMVGICLERSVEMMVGLLGILKAGGAYVPLDMNYPLERLQWMMEETQAPYVITIEKWRTILPTGHHRLILLDSDKEKISDESDGNTAAVAEATNLACVIFTSGSTGKPKGVCILNQGVVRLVKGANYARMDEETITLAMAPVAFDVSLCEIWGSLTNGGRLILVPWKHPSVEELKRLIQQQGVNTWFLTVALFHLLVEQGMGELTSLQQLLTGGDVLSPAHARSALEQLPQLSLVNSYGPTENTCYSSFFRISEPHLLHSSVPIGRPNSNSHLYILDKWMQPVPVGIPGELYTGGDGLARGYLNREELTAERFVANPFQPPLSTHLYKTGDQARYLSDGNVEFMGRLDNQVKIRGFRIELGEIEAVIKQYSEVSDAIVITEGTTPGDKRLVAYVVARPSDHFETEALRKYLKDTLPDYMVPAFIKQVNAWQLTPHGKIDKKSLPQAGSPVQVKASNEAPLANKQASDDSLETYLTKIWTRVLGLEHIGLDDNFFELGGHSLLAVKLVSAIHLQSGKTLPVITVFAKPTIREMAHFIRMDLGEYFWHSLVPVQPKGHKKPLFCVHPVMGEVEYVYKLAPYFDENQPLYGLQAVGLNGIDTPLSTIEEMATHYLQLVLKQEPQGPYRLAGYSLGGVIAYEMATRLRKMGKEVSVLALIDTYPHKPGRFTYWHMPISAVLRNCLHFLLEPTISLSDKWETTAREVPFFLNHLRNKYKKQFREEAKNGDKEPIQAGQKVMEAINRANLSYSLKPDDVKVVFFRTMEGPTKYLKYYDFGWQKYARQGVTLYNLPGHHGSLFKNSSNIKIIAETLESYL